MKRKYAIIPDGFGTYELRCGYPWEYGLLWKETNYRWVVVGTRLTKKQALKAAERHSRPTIELFMDSCDD